MTLGPVGENNRDFDDPESLSPEDVRHLNLKAVAVGLDGLEIDGLQRTPAETFVTARRVGKRHAGDQLTYLPAPRLSIKRFSGQLMTRMPSL